MRLPNAIRILGTKVKIVRKLLEKGGYFYADPEYAIEISTDLSEHETTRAFTHEFNHAVMDIASLNDAVKDGVDEIIVNQFAKAYRDAFVLIPKGIGDTVVKHYAIYTTHGELLGCFGEESFKSRPPGKDEIVVELTGVTKFKRKRKVKSEV